MLTPRPREIAIASLLFLGTPCGCVRDSQSSTRSPENASESSASTSGGNQAGASQPADLLEQSVGERALATVADPDTVAFADLKIIAADDAETSESLADPTRIAGYPIVGTLVTLGDSQADVAVKAFADPDNYDPGRSSRCRIGRIIGFRFVRGADQVDIALTDPCALAMWSFKRDDANDEWAAPFHRGLTQRIIALLETR